MKKNGLPILAVILTSAFPVLYLFFNNAAGIAVKELWAPLGLFIAFGLALFAVSFAFVRSLPKAAVIACLFIIIFENYALFQTGVQALIPSFGVQHILPIVLFIAAHLAWLLHKKLSKDVCKTVAMFFCIIFGVLTVFNGVIAAPKIVKNNSLQQKTEVTETSNLAKGDLPNLYYFIFDEYSNFDIIKKYYDYDNSAFGTFLEDKGFTVSYDSVNDSQQTATILGNVFSLDYVVSDDDTTVEKINARKDSVLHKTLLSANYDVRGIGNAYEFLKIPQDSAEVSTENNKATTMGGDSFFTSLLKNTVAMPFLPIGDGKKERKAVEDVFSFCENDANFQRKNNVATISYLKTPHQPFVFTADGGENNFMNWHDWVNKEHYLNQFIYTTTFIQEIVDSVIEKDPNAVIILQSDHSARSLQDASGTALIDTYDKRHFLNAVYYGGGDMSEIKGQSGVNTIRIVLSKLLDEDYPIVEVPSNE